MNFSPAPTKEKTPRNRGVLQGCQAKSVEAVLGSEPRVAPGIVVGKEEKYRGQHVELWVQVPAGKSVRFTDAALKNKSWAFQPDSLYTMQADGDLSLSAGNRVL